MSSRIDLDARSQSIIKALVEEYVRNGEPVASAKLAGKRGIDLSSASVRNVLARLEESGLIEQVHTSSGRRPTASGMHIYLNTLLHVQSPSAQTVSVLEENIRTESTNEMVHSAMDTVSKLTQMVTLVSVPGVAEAQLKSVQFLRLTSQRVMAVLVTKSGEVRNRLLELDHEINTRELELASQFFNEHFVGRTMAQARAELGTKISNLQLRIAELLRNMLAQITETEPGKTEVMTSGPEQFFANPKLFADSKKLSELTALLQRKETLLHILDRGVLSNDVSVFIGVESGVPELAESSVVMAPYLDANANVLGVLGLIGPMNMKYSKVMPLMEVTTALMQQALVKINREYS